MSSRHQLRIAAISTALVALVATGGSAFAQKKYDSGATDTEIKVGNIMPYSGPASAYGIIGKTEAAYFQMINDQGGVNGRKIKLISVDDAFNPSKTVERTRKMVESDGIFFDYAPVGTAPNLAVKQYLNDSKIPQLLLQSGIPSWNDPAHFPWSMSGLPARMPAVSAKTSASMRASGQARLMLRMSGVDSSTSPRRLSATIRMRGRDGSVMRVVISMLMGAYRGSPARSTSCRRQHRRRQRRSIPAGNRTGAN